MSKVIELGGITKLDIPVNKILDSAKDELKSVVIIGWDKTDHAYFASSIADGGEVLWLLKLCEQKLITGSNE